MACFTGEHVLMGVHDLWGGGGGGGSCFKGGYALWEYMPFRRKYHIKGHVLLEKIFDLKVCLKWKCVIQENLFYKRT